MVFVFRERFLYALFYGNVNVFFVAIIVAIIFLHFAY